MYRKQFWHDKPKGLCGKHKYTSSSCTHRNAKTPLDLTYRSEISMDAIPHIDVTPPYFALKDISVLPALPGNTIEGISCTFSREQPSGRQITHFDAAEIGRHLAILGSLVAARANSVKQKHYYLALYAHLHINEINTPLPTLQGTGFVAEPVEWGKRRVTAYMEAVTPGGEQYARLKVRYAVLTQERLLRITRSPDPTRNSGNTWIPSQPSPYAQPIMLRKVRISKDEASATLSLCDASRMAGHFDRRPMAPIAVLASNAIAVLGILLLLLFYAKKSWLCASGWRLRAKCWKSSYDALLQANTVG